MKQQQQLLFLYIASILLWCTATVAQTPAAAVAPAPAPAGPPNITKVLDKAGQFTVLIRMLRSTQMEDQINTQLNNSNQGLTLFAPTDNSFAALKPGTLNSLSDQQKVQLLQFHVIPSYLSATQFQTVSNPIRTQAGDSGDGEFPLNITTGGNQVNVSTGLVDATISNTLVSDGQLAVYEVDKVLLPLDIFAPKPPAPAPAPASEKPRKKSAVSADAPSGGTAANASGAVGFAPENGAAAVIAAVVVAFSSL